MRALAQEAGDLSSQCGGVQQFAHGTGMIKEFPLQLCRQRVPPHDQRRPQAPQDALLFRCQRRIAGAAVLQNRRQLVEIIGKLVVIIGKPLLVVGEHGEAPFVRLKFTHLVGSISLFGQLGVFGRFRTILLGGEHGRAFLLRAPPPNS